MGETRVDLFHLLEDLRDAYVGPIEETILTEITANALDSGASSLSFSIDSQLASLTIVDNGSGMLRRELARYHDIAASTKRKGQGIGFAGVGIKLGLLACRDVVTETRRGSTHVATTWGLASKHRAPWKWTPPAGLVADRGTAVQLRLANTLSPLLDPTYLDVTLRRQFATLFDRRFDRLLAEHGRRHVVFSIDGRPIDRGPDGDGVVVPIDIRLARKRKPSAVGYLVRRATAAPEDEQGIAVSTLGKVITRGWDWLGLTPAAGDVVGGLVEIPALAAALTLNKADFVRTGAGGALYLGYRKALQEVVTRQLATWGDLRSPAADRPPTTIGLREFEKVLESLSDEFPLLASLVEQRRGGQKRLPMAADALPARPLPVAGVGPDHAGSAPPPADTSSDAADEHEAPPPAANPPPLDDLIRNDTPLPGPVGLRRPVRFGLRLSFDRRDDDQDVARLVESTVSVNTAHPSYTRALTTRAMGYHVAVAVAMALAPVAVEAADHHAFLTNFLAKWGGALASSPARRRAKKRRPRA